MEHRHALLGPQPDAQLARARCAAALVVAAATCGGGVSRGAFAARRRRQQPNGCFEPPAPRLCGWVSPPSGSVAALKQLLCA